MNRNVIKYIIDIGLLLSFLGVSFTGVVKFRSFLSLIGINLDYSSMNMTLYRQIHDWSGIVMIFLVLIHLIVNWDWIVSMTKKIFYKEEEEDSVEEIKVKKKVVKKK